MVISLFHRRLKRVIGIFFVFMLFFSGANFGHADEDAEERAVEEMEARVEVLEQMYDVIKERVDDMPTDEPKKKYAETLKKTAEEAVEKLTKIDDDDKFEDYLNDAKNASNEDFDELEKQASNAIRELNFYLHKPSKPGQAPEGRFVEDFIPQFVRLLFKFTYLAIFVSLVYSSVLLITAMGEEEKIRKGKEIIYYSLIGFAFVTLAFALVRAVTDITFF